MLWLSPRFCGGVLGSPHWHEDGSAGLKEPARTLSESPDMNLWPVLVFTLSQVDLCVPQLTIHAPRRLSQTTPDNCGQNTALLKIEHSDTQVPPREAAQQSDRWSLWSSTTPQALSGGKVQISCQPSPALMLDAIRHTE